MRVLLFEDEAVKRLAPITTGRAAFQILCGCHRLIDLARRVTEEPLYGWVRDYLRPLLFTPDAGLDDWQSTIPSEEPILALNAALVPSLAAEETIRDLLAREQPFALVVNSRIVACLLPAEDLTRFDPNAPAAIAHLPTLPAMTEDAAGESLRLFDWPHEIVAEHMRLLPTDLPAWAEASRLRQTEHGVYVGKGVTIGPHVVTDTSEGPIVLRDGVQVGPFAYLRGPLLVGANSRINEHAALKDGVTLGHTTKIGGEVEASVVDSYSNKQHHGFLGHSYLGSWINLGAGTCNSDLKNTYGKINVEYGDHKVSTGMQFFGCIIGDYSKTAINTGIFTGKIIGVCSMLYGFVTTNVPSFVNYARLFGQIAELPPDVMIATQARMFARRRVPQRECDQELIRAMYTATTDERSAGLPQVVNL